jgi:hypothetical protein
MMKKLTKIRRSDVLHERFRSAMFQEEGLIVISHQLAWDCRHKVSCFIEERVHSNGESRTIFKKHVWKEVDGMNELVFRMELLLDQWSGGWQTICTIKELADHHSRLHHLSYKGSARRTI